MVSQGKTPPIDELLKETAAHGDLSTLFQLEGDAQDIARELAQDLDVTEVGDDKKRAQKKKCGPDVSDWFRNELERHRRNLDDVRGNFIPALWIMWVWKHGMSIQYKSADFKTKDCPSGCKNTVWLCGHCMDRSELGNIVLGFWVAYLGFPARVLAAGVNVIGAKKPGEGADNPTDTSSLGLGFWMGRELRKARGKAKTPKELKTEAGFCAFFNTGLPWSAKELKAYFSIFKNGKIWSDGWAEPFRHISKGKEDCKRCSDVWTGRAHPLPSAKPPLK